MTKEEIVYLAESKIFPSKEWKKAFDDYNNDAKNVKLSLGCRSCYQKVLTYLIKKYL